jgi:hypothetical protein
MSNFITPFVDDRNLYKITTKWFPDNSSLTIAEIALDEDVYAIGCVVCAPLDKFEKNYAIMKSKGLADKALSTQKCTERNIGNPAKKSLAYKEMYNMNIGFRSTYYINNYGH